jgi:hypothetical protein
MTPADEASPDGELGTVGLDAKPGGGQVGVPPLVVHGPGGTVTLPAGQVYLIGRDPGADVVVDAPQVSWQHAQLLATAGQWLIQDAGSTNGTFSGGLRVRRMRITGTVQFRLGHREDGPLLSCSVDGAAPAGPAGVRRGGGGPPRRPRPPGPGPGHPRGHRAVARPPGGQAANGDHPGPRPGVAYRPG